MKEKIKITEGDALNSDTERSRGMPKGYKQTEVGVIRHRNSPIRNPAIQRQNAKNRYDAEIVNQ